MKQTILGIALCLAILSGGAQADAQTAVQAVALQPAMWRTRIQVPASLEAAEHAALAAAAGGIITGVFFHSGQVVAGGQLLVQLDNAQQLAQLGLDNARLNEAQRDLARTQKLMSISGASQAALEQAVAGAQEAVAQVALDKAELTQRQIAAPFAGAMDIRNLDPGDYVQAGQAVAGITAPGALRVHFSVPQSEASGLASGAAFTLMAPEGDGTTLRAQGQITALDPGQDEATDARAVEGRITGQANGLLPGMAAVVELATGAPQPAFSVPSTALNDSTLGPFLYVLQPGTNSTTLGTVYVTIFGNDGADTLVSAAGLTAFEKVVAIGGFKLSDGAVVTLETR